MDLVVSGQARFVARDFKLLLMQYMSICKVSALSVLYLSCKLCNNMCFT